MPLVIRNRNKHIYRIKSGIRRYAHQHYFILKNYLKLKEFFIKRIDIPNISNNGLFRKVFIETISYCNNDCSFCPASSKLGAKKPENLMSEDLYVKILNELIDISFKGSIAFHCNNEPLLDERLASWIKIARDLLKTNFLYLYTNGILIDIKLANQLFDAGLNRIIIDNYSDKHELIPSVESIIDKSSLLRGEIILNYRSKDGYMGNRAGESPNAGVVLKKPVRIICVRPSAEIVVGYDGTVLLCCADGLWKVKMGDVKKTSLSDIWFSGFFREVRKSLKTGDRNCTEICKVCDGLSFFAPRGIRE